MNTPLSLRLIDAVASVPPLRPANIVPIVVMLSLWTVLVQAGSAMDRAFVTILVMGQAYAVWRNLPRASCAISQPGRDHSQMLVWLVGAMLTLGAAQLILCDPVFSQRLLSAGCVFVLLVMALGMRHEHEVIARVGVREDVHRVPLLRTNAGVAVLTLVVNEMLIAAGDLTVWVTGMAIYALVVHFIYWFIVLLVLPPGDNQA